MACWSSLPFVVCELWYYFICQCKLLKTLYVCFGRCDKFLNMVSLCKHQCHPLFQHDIIFFNVKIEYEVNIIYEIRTFVKKTETNTERLQTDYMLLPFGSDNVAPAFLFTAAPNLLDLLCEKLVVFEGYTCAFCTLISMWHGFPRLMILSWKSWRMNSEVTFNKKVKPGTRRYVEKPFSRISWKIKCCVFHVVSCCFITIVAETVKKH